MKRFGEKTERGFYSSILCVGLAEVRAEGNRHGLMLELRFFAKKVRVPLTTGQARMLAGQLVRISDEVESGR